jgi:hypothetical protein
METSIALHLRTYSTLPVSTLFSIFLKCKMECNQHYTDGISAEDDGSKATQEMMYQVCSLRNLVNKVQLHFNAFYNTVGGPFPVE